MSDLPSDMEEEVLSRLPVTYLGELRSTCKKWKPSTKGGGFSKKRQRKGTEVVMMVEHRVPLTSVDLLYPSIGNLDAGGVDISKLSHWWIEPINSYHRWDSYALGYDKEKHKAFGDTVTLSSVRQEQLAVLFQKYGAPGTGGVVKIWITNKIDPNAVSWSNLFLAVDTKPVIGLRFKDSAGSFFVDEEKKVAAVLDKVILDKDRGKTALPTGNIAHMIGNNGYLKKVDIGECINKRLCYPLVCSYVPSAVQVGNTP